MFLVCAYRAAPCAYRSGFANQATTMMKQLTNQPIVSVLQIRQFVDQARHTAAAALLVKKPGK